MTCRSAAFRRLRLFWALWLGLGALGLGLAVAGETDTAPALADPATPEALAAVLEQLPTALPEWGAGGPPSSWLPADSDRRLGAQAADLRDYRFQWGASVALIAPGGATITLDALRFASDLDAFGVYSRRIGDATRQAQVGTAAFWEGHTLRVWQGPYYLILKGRPREERTTKLMLAVAQVLSDHLPRPVQEPLLLRLMPRARMINQSLRYFWRQVGNLPPFREALMAEYEGAQGRVLLLFARAADEAEARQLYLQTRRQIDTTGQARPLPGVGEQVVVIPTEDRGLCFMLQESAYVVIAMRIGDRPLAEALLRIALTNIHIVRP